MAERYNKLGIVNYYTYICTIVKQNTMEHLKLSKQDIQLLIDKAKIKLSACDTNDVAIHYFNGQIDLLQLMLTNANSK